MLRNRFTVLIIFCLTMSFAFRAMAVEVSKTEEKTYKLDAGGLVSILADDGDIRITSWNRNEVKVKMTMRAWGRSRREAQRQLDDIEVQVQSDRDRLVIKEVTRGSDKDFNFFDLFEEEFWRNKNWRDGSIDFEIVVPKEVELQLRTDDGNVQVADTNGKLVIELDEGDVEIDNIVSEHIQVDVDEGDIEFTNVRHEGTGLWKINADEGNIYLKNSETQEIDVSTDEGEIYLMAIQVLRFWLSTDEGDIEVEFQPMKDGRYRMETDEGNIDIALPENANIQLDLETYEGRIDSDFNLSIRGRDDGEVLDDALGRNEALLKGFTDEGDIVLRRR